MTAQLRLSYWADQFDKHSYKGGKAYDELTTILPPSFEVSPHHFRDKIGLARWLGNVWNV